LLHALSQAFALQRVQVGQRGTGHRLSRSISQPEVRSATGAIVRKHRRAFGGAVMLEATTQVNAAARGHFGGGLWNADARDARTVQVYKRHGDRYRRRRTCGQQSAEATQVQVLRMQPCRGAVVLDPQPDLSAFCIGQTHYSFDELTVR
jgi:hypothetical protein